MEHNATPEEFNRNWDDQLLQPLIFLTMAHWRQLTINKSANLTLLHNTSHWLFRASPSSSLRKKKVITAALYILSIPDFGRAIYRASDIDGLASNYQIIAEKRGVHLINVV